MGTTQEWIIDRENLTLNEDWFMELGAVGSEISMKVWKASEPEPSMAQLSVIDTEMISSGTIGLTAAMTPASATEPLMLSTYYDDVTFTVPEPATLSLAVFASLAVLAFSRQRR